MPRKKKSKGRLKRVSIRVERRPEPDWDRFAFALLQFTKLKSRGDGSPRKPKGKP